ncbi:ATP-binding protein [Falsiroseomonas sp. CW058]|uniref:hybrid sensor histidine kinase/response regulator n=1 Tax=Falsiroseomonas sp. CW058 TaxID=3388664 RepID=UPI003D31FF33
MPTSVTPAIASPAGSRAWSLLVLASPLLAVLPLVAYAVVFFLGLQAERGADLRTDLNRTAAGLSTMVEMEVAADLGALETLAASPRLELGVLLGFRDEAARLLAQRPAWYTLALVEADRQVINLRHSRDAPLPPASDLLVRGVLQTGRASVGVLQDGQVALRVPVRIGGTVRYALVAVLPSLALGHALDRLGVPQGWSALLLDEEGRVLARAGSGALPEAAFRPAPPAGQVAALEGGRLGLVRPVAGTRWVVAVAAPEGSFLVTARNWLLVALGLSALVGAVSVAVRILGRHRRQELDRQRRATQAAEEREKQERRRADLLATVSHELRTPLTGLLGYTDLLSRAELPPNARGWVEQQQRAGQALLALIGDVLDFARLEEGAVELEDADLDLPALLEDCAGILRGLAQQKGLALVVEADPGLPRWIRGDPLRLRQVVTNLVGNAIKFTRSGQVTVAARLTPRPELVEISVSDTGAGIPAEMLPHIFDRFRQAGADTARRFGGSGLGLAICRRLVTAMGGAIGAESTPGKGSRFAFRIPFRPGAAPVARRTGKLRILVAEDVPASRLLLSAVLERAGHVVTATEDGARALAALHNASFDMVLMDLNMPGMDGYGVAAAIRMLPGEQSRVPLVALTADAPEEIEPRCREAGFDAVLRKPFETRRLLGLIDALRTRPEGQRHVPARVTAG